MKIILSGGGTIGSVTPLLAIAEKLEGDDILFVGTKGGPEKELVETKNIKFTTIFSAKFRRYFDIRNLIDLIKLKLACLQSLFLLIKEKPDVIISAGGYVAVPLIWMGWLLRIPALVHSQDIKTGLAIKLTKPFAKKVTKVFSDTDLKAKVVGNPVRNLKPTTNFFNLKNNKPVVLITGGGTGALTINNLINENFCEIAQIIHLTGKNKNLQKIKNPDYYSFDFLKQEMSEALEKADLVISRAGLGTLTELAVLGKPAIIIPIINSHQEANAKYFKNRDAIEVLEQAGLTPEKLNEKIKNLLNNKDRLEILSNNIKKIIKPNAAEKIVEIIQNI